jgi:hypothetical protein
MAEQHWRSFFRVFQNLIQTISLNLDRQPVALILNQRYVQAAPQARLASSIGSAW